MRRFLPGLLLLLLSLPLLGGERVVRGGSDVLLGDATLGPMSDWRGNASVSSIATDGDQVTLFWMARYSVYAQRLDRDGNAVDPIPRVLVQGRAPAQPYVDRMVAVYAGGQYTVFYSLHNENRWSMRALRLTRELEPISDQGLSTSDAFVVDAVSWKDEIVLAVSREVVRLRHDLTVIERLTNFDVTDLVPAPHGVLAITNQEPAIGARMLDGTASVRIASTYNPTTVKGVWTGSQFVVAWADYGSTYLTSLDANLLPTKPVSLDKLSCGGCVFSVEAIGPEEAVVSWDSAGATRAARVRNGAVIDATPWVLGPAPVTLFKTAGGRFLTVDSKLSVRMFDLPPASSPAALPVVMTARTAMQEVLTDVAVAPTEIAVARHRPNGSNVVSILDREGRPLREIVIRDGASVSLAHDGQDFYALIFNYSTAAFQRVAAGATATSLPFGVADALEWSGKSFIILQSGYADFTGATQYKTRVLSLTREGKVELPPCPVWEFPTTAERVAMFRAGDAVNIVVGTYETSIRPDCEFMPLVKLPDHWRTRAAWQDGMWARAQWYTGGLTIAFARSLGETVDPHRVPSTGAVTMEVFDVAPLGDDDWVVAFSDGGVRTAVFDEAGHLVGTSKVSDAPAARVILVPIEHNRTLLIQQQIVWDAPFHGVYRVVVTPLTTESASRRRTVRR